MISFTSPEFIFRFLPIFMLIYCLVPSKARKYVLLLGSLVFYTFGEPIFVILLIILTILNFVLANKGYKFRRTAPENEVLKERKRYMLCAVVLDVTVLVLFKCLSAFVDNGLLPLGLSFYIFKMISYQIDTVRGDIVKRPSFIETATYFMMFPQITQGPIMRYEDGEFHKEKKPTAAAIEEGLRLFVIGFAMKTLLADRIGILWNDLGMYGYQSISTPLAWLGAFAYSFELYFDFWGYSLMSSGILVALGFEFVRNFDHPYAAESISDFYRRWHVTLGAFFRDYIYFPLGGSRCAKSRIAMNLAVVWLLTGFWHGNGINFIIWGAVLGLFIIAEKLFLGKYLKKIRGLSHLYVIFVIPLTWVVFAIKDIPSLLVYFGRLFPVIPTETVVNSGDFISYLSDYKWMFLAAIILCIPKVSELYKKYEKSWVVTILLTGLFWVSVYFSVSAAGNPFMYLNF